MNIGINSSLLSSTFAVSVSLHCIALAVLTNSLLFQQFDNPPVFPLEKPALKTIEVSLETLPSRLTVNKQPNIPVAKSQLVSGRMVSKIPVPAKTEVARKVMKSVEANMPKPVNEKSAARLAHVKKLFKSQRKTLKMPDILLSKMSDQSMPTNKLTVISDAPTQALIAKTPLSNRHAWQVNQTQTHQKLSVSHQSSANSAQPTSGKPTTHLPGYSSSLPPLLKSRQPDYPDEARWEERTGKATLKFKITGEGRVIEPHVTKSSGHRDLDMAAIRAIQFWRFKAEESQVYNQWYQYSFRFQLN